MKHADKLSYVSLKKKKITNNEFSTDRTVERCTLIRLSIFDQNWKRKGKREKENVESNWGKWIFSGLTCLQNKSQEKSLQQTVVSWACARRHQIPNSDIHIIICIIMQLSHELSNLCTKSKQGHPFFQIRFGPHFPCNLASLFRISQHFGQYSKIENWGQLSLK